LRLTRDALDSLPVGYTVSASEISALSGQNQVKGIHPLVPEEPRSVIILSTLQDGDYPDQWLDPSHESLLYCLEGRIDRGLGRKTYNRNWKSNQAVAQSGYDTYPVHVFWRTSRKTAYQYAGKYVFAGWVEVGVHQAFLLKRMREQQRQLFEIAGQEPS
jgi:hypothetical protein